MSTWKPIEGRIERKVLVTNNLEARDAHGQMSHVWVASLVQEDDGNDYITFTDSAQKIWGLTHYAELPTNADPLIVADMLALLRLFAREYEDQNINHVDFRVSVKHRAEEMLAKATEPRP